MACPFIGNQRTIPLDPDAENEKPSFSDFHSIDTTLSSSGPSEKPKSPEYGLDTANFNQAFLSSTFDPKHMSKIVREAIIIAAGPAAILLQVANPGVAAGVNRHSNFAYRVEDRLRTTMTFVYCMAFGTPDEKRAVIHMVHEAHKPVAGEGYSADDVDLQMWVAATLYATGTDIYSKIFGEFSEEEAEAIYADYAVLATSLRVPPERWPKSRKAFWKYWDESLAGFTVTQDAVAVKNDMLYNKTLPLWVRMHLPILRVATAEWLPGHIREAYGWKKESRGRRVGYWMLNAVVQSTYPNLPRKWRYKAVDFYLSDMRKRLATGGPVIGGKKE
ncbi:hypothetical protein BS50DRAFT_576280 [Corynespora cassiicola Philippines]|uniref:ER-bound oxygenase mpaB/mpaB'/Rubber oxygenase catalytic domain-containing protein n=1 Tax=Corynespora cassiicola Philippines TaxID=1448308 RepID=A0A2T2NE59_CORCC|nr:hypothetical protein BS50DRAFT_576280 [Corynespora cassiicola Philippines]